MHRDAAAAVRRPRPLLLRPVAVELDAVAVRVAQVDRLGDAVVGGAVDRPLRVDEPLERVAELRPVRVADRDVVEAGRAGRRRRAAARLPRVQAEVVVVAAGRDERRLVAVSAASRRSRGCRGRSRASGRCRRPSGGRGRCRRAGRCSCGDDSAWSRYTFFYCPLPKDGAGTARWRRSPRMPQRLRAPRRRGVQRSEHDHAEHDQQRLNPGGHETTSFRADGELGMQRPYPRRGRHLLSSCGSRLTMSDPRGQD